MAKSKTMIVKDLVKTDTVLTPGQLVEFSVFSIDENAFYSSRVQDFNNATMMVDMPFDDRRVPIIPRPGEQIFGKLAGKNCAYRFTTTFVKAVSGGLPMWVINKPKVVEKFQNREFVRVKVTRPIIVHPLDEDGAVQDMVSTNTVDISGGGVCVVLFNPIKVGNRVTLNIDNIPGMELIQVMGEVARCHPVDVAGVKLFHVGIKFIELSAQEQSRLVRFVFELQRKNLRMGIEG